MPAGMYIKRVQKSHRGSNMPAGMYIKRVQKSHRGSNKTYTYLHLVENVHTWAAHRSPNTG